MSDDQKPVAWAVTPTGKHAEIDCEFIYPDAATAGDVALGCAGVVVPLYRHQQPTLTDAADVIEKLRAEIMRLNDEAAVIVTQTQRVMLLDANLTTDAINVLHAEITRLRLTAAEREAVELAYSRLTADTHYASVAATLRGLLERLK